MEIKRINKKNRKFFCISNLGKVQDKKGYFFSLDAFIALIIVLGIVLLISPSVKQTAPEIHIQEDLLKVLSSLRIGEVENQYVSQLISEGRITNLNQSVLEQIGEFYAKSQPEAKLLAQEILNQFDNNYNIGIYFNGIPLAEKSSIDLNNAKDVWTSRQIISGIQEGESAKGYSSRAFLSSSDKIDYFYFGGYVGDGNITLRIEDDVIDVDIEAVFSGPFDIYINGVFIEHYIPEINIPFRIELFPYVDEFNLGINSLEFRGDENIYISGGYVKVKHDTSSELTSSQKKYFPGIDGLINLYDGVYIPGELNSMTVSLHYNSEYNIFFNLGNKTIYSGNTGGNEQTIALSNSELSSLIDYSELSQKTIPFRIGLENVSYYANLTKNADVFSVTDLSSSMNSNIPSLGVKMIDLARNANRKFIQMLLENPLNRVGLVGYNTGISPGNYHVLSNNIISLNNSINIWETKAGNCVCCGIINATESFVQQSTPEKYKFMVVMTDGSMQGTCYSGSNSATQDAIRASCEAYNNYNIIVYTVGFGDNADDITLQAMASCGNGNYYHSSIEEIVGIYSEIAKDIINATYVEQKIVGENINTKIFPDSYIYLDYEKEIPYGLVISAESSEFGNAISEGSFFIPNNTQIYEVKVISYSGSKWTDNVEVRNESQLNWEKVFDLSNYGREYVELGDPYIINIPINKVNYGVNNVRVSTALNPGNSTGGSPYNKIFYNLVKETSGYSPIVSAAEGCTWILEFEDSSNSTIKIPSNYSGEKTCYYTSDNLAYNNNDAIDLAIYRLLSSLDLNSNRKIEIRFSENDLLLSSTEVEGIPFTWDTEVQARVWR